MDTDARRALRVIRRCVELDRFALSGHFEDMLEARGLFWPDVLHVLDNPVEVRDDGLDKWDHPKWAVTGTSALGTEAVEVVCTIRRTPDGDFTLFITVYEA